MWSFTPISPMKTMAQSFATEASLPITKLWVSRRYLIMPMWILLISLLDRQIKRSLEQGYGSLCPADSFDTSPPLSQHLLSLQILMNVTLTMLLRTVRGLGVSTFATTTWAATSVLAGLATSSKVTATLAKVN